MINTVIIGAAGAAKACATTVIGAGARGQLGGCPQADGGLPPGARWLPL